MGPGEFPAVECTYLSRSWGIDGLGCRSKATSVEKGKKEKVVVPSSARSSMMACAKKLRYVVYVRSKGDVDAKVVYR
jgi:hypothetical protein